MTIKQIKEKLAAVAEQMRKIHAAAEGRSLSTEQDAVWSRLRSEHEALERDLGREKFAEAKLNDSDQIVRQFVRDENGNPVELGREDRTGSDDLLAGSWRDQSGRTVRTYRPGQSIAASHGVDREMQGVGIGAILRALITGPRSEVERRALAEGTNSAGGFTVPLALSAQFYDLVRAKSVCARAGAQTIIMDTETLKMAKLLTDIPAGWRSENGPVAASDPTFGAVELKARSLAGLITLSRELVADSLNIEAMLAAAVAAKFATEIDRVCLVGTGTPPEPKGIRNTSGIAQRYLGAGADGGAIADHGFLLNLRGDLETANASPTAYVMHPRTALAVASLKEVAGQWISIPEWVAGTGLLADGATPAKFMTTTAMPIDETRGVSVNASTCIAGDFRSLILGLRERISIEIVPGLGAGNGQVSLVVHARADCSVVRATDFAACGGIIP